MTTFDHYARYYDLLYKDKDYIGEAAFIASQLKLHFPEAHKVLELGCGTGLHAQLLVEAGFEVHGVDLSNNMLEIAACRKESLAPVLADKLSFELGDVRSFRTAQQFDAVISLFHVFSYQTRNADIEAAFKTASSHLKPGGILIFDYWYGPAVLLERPDTRIKRFAENNFSIVRIAEPEIEETTNTVAVNYDIFTQHGNQQSNFKERHLMRYFFLPEIELLAKASNFDCKTHQEWLGENAPTNKSWSAFTVAVKK